MISGFDTHCTLFNYYTTHNNTIKITKKQIKNQMKTVYINLKNYN